MNDTVLFAILAVDLNLGIGFENKILFHNPVDMFVFKTYTSIIKNCIVGRTTYDGLPSIINKTRNLKILTNNKELVKLDEKYFNDFSSIAFQKAIVIGGAQLYRLLAPSINVWILTVHKNTTENVDTFLDKNLYDFITSYKFSFLLYDDEDISIVIYYK